jgi:hypothetical protein
MKKRLSLGAVSLLIGISTMTLPGSQDRASDERSKDQFVGAWRLVWLEEQGSDGKIHSADCTGLLVYTRDGHMSVEVMYQHPQAEINAAPVQYAQGGYEASFGTLTSARTTSPITSRAHWCEPLSAKTSRAYTNFRASS